MGYCTKSIIWIAIIFSLFLFFEDRAHYELNMVVLTLFVASFVCELIDSSFGMGYGTMLTPILLLSGFLPAQIIPTMLFSQLVCSFSAAFFHHEIENVNLSLQGEHLERSIFLILGSVIGAIIGVLVSISISHTILVALIGIIIILTGLFVLFWSNRSIAYKKSNIMLIATLAGFNKSVSGGGYGPVVTSGQIISGSDGKSAVGITAFVEGITCIVGVATFLFEGGSINLSILAPMIAGGLISVPFSALAVSYSKERNHKLIIGLLTLFLGSLTLYKALI